MKPVWKRVRRGAFTAKTAAAVGWDGSRVKPASAGGGEVGPERIDRRLKQGGAAPRTSGGGLDQGRDCFEPAKEIDARVHDGDRPGPADWASWIPPVRIISGPTLGAGDF